MSAPFIPANAAVHPARLTVQSSIPTIPCIIFNQLILPCYLLPMFACTEPRSVYTVYPACPETRRELRGKPRSTDQDLRLQFACSPVPLTPLFATHTSRPQITENPVTLSPFPATHTDIAPVSPVFATHTKTTGVYTNNSHSGTHPRSSAKRVSCSAPPLLGPPVTSHESPVTDSPPTCLPDRLPVPRTCILRTIGAILSLQQTFYGSPFLLFLCGRV